MSEPTEKQVNAIKNMFWALGKDVPDVESKTHASELISNAKQELSDIREACSIGKEETVKEEYEERN